MTKGRIIGLGIGIVMILAAFGIVVWQGLNAPTTNTAFAQAGATATAIPPTPASGAAPQAQMIGDDFWTRLAGKLGVKPDDLKAKAVQARQEMLDQAVKDGRITPAQADALKQRITSNNIIAPIPLARGWQANPNKPKPPAPGFGPFNNPGKGKGPFKGTPGMMFGRGMNGGVQELETLAKVLQLEPKALIQQLAQGKTLADIARTQGVSEATVKQALIDARKAQIDQLLTYGLLSQVQAEQMKAQLSADKLDLTRPYWFQFHIAPRLPQSSNLAPGFGQEQAWDDMTFDAQTFGDAFGLAPDELQLWGEMFDATGGALFLLPDSVLIQ